MKFPVLLFACLSFALSPPRRLASCSAASMSTTSRLPLDKSRD